MSKDTPKEGIFIGKNSKGFFFRFKQNKFILATGQGYNTKAGARKGIRAIARMVGSNFLLEEHLPIVDLTTTHPLKKKASTGTTTNKRRRPDPTKPAGPKRKK